MAWAESARVASKRHATVNIFAVKKSEKVFCVVAETCMTASMVRAKF
jgi:hypothetical protein